MFIRNALKKINNKIESADKSFAKYMDEAASFYTQNKYADAIEACNKAIELKIQDESSYAYALYVRGLSLFHIDKYTEALEDFTAALKLLPDTINILPTKGEIYQACGDCNFRLKKFNEALKDYDQSIKYYNMFSVTSDKRSAKVFSSRARCLIELDRYKEALQDCNVAIEIDPNYLTPYDHRGTCLFALNEFQDALNSYNQAMEIGPNDASLYEGRGSCFYQLGKLNEALCDYYQSLKIDPDDEYVKQQITKALDALEFLKSHSEKSSFELIEDNKYPAALLKRSVKLGELRKNHNLNFDEAQAYFELASYDWLLIVIPLIKQKNLNMDVSLIITSHLLGLSSTSTEKIIDVFYQRVSSKSKEILNIKFNMFFKEAPNNAKQDEYKELDEKRLGC